MIISDVISMNRLIHLSVLYSGMRRDKWSKGGKYNYYHSNPAVLAVMAAEPDDKTNNITLKQTPNLLLDC